jgi:proline dehydrogenase
MGCVATVDILGEHVRLRDGAVGTFNAYLDLLERLRAADLPSGISVKPTAVGLAIDPELCLRHVKMLAEAAASSGRFVRIDMEESAYTTAILDLAVEANREHANLGAVIQARLKRSEADLERLLRERISVRLCKGIYLEPADRAYTDFDQIRTQFLKLLDPLLEAGCFVGIATHDPYLVDQGLRLVRRHGQSRFEFQMLMGVGEPLRAKLVAEGHRVRVYVPYGEDWYGYSVRRLQENPGMATQVALGTIRSVFSRGGRKPSRPPG